MQRLHRQLPRPEQVQLIDALPQAQLLRHLRSSLALLSASTEEGFDYPFWSQASTHLISDIPVHREFHHRLFSVDDGAALADRDRLSAGSACGRSCHRTMPWHRR